MTTLLTRAARNLRAELRSQPPGSTFGDSSIPSNSMAGLSGTGPGMVTKVTGAMAISTVLNCLRVLHDDFSTLPFVGYTGEKRGIRVISKVQPPIVAEPFGPDLAPEAGMGQIVVSVKASGNAYLWVSETDRLGYPTLLQVLDPGDIKPKRDPASGKKVFKSGSKTYDTSQIKHIAGLMLPGSVMGIDPLSFQRITNQLAVDVGQYASNFFQNGDSPGGVIEAPGAADKTKAREIAQAWEASHSGVTNSHRPGVLMGGAKWNQTAIPPENAQFLQTREFLRSEISGWYGVPLTRINAAGTERTPSAGEGVETIDEDYAKHALLPLAVAIEGVWNAMVPGDLKTWTMFDFDGLLRPSPLRRAQIAQVHRVTAVRSPNEIRAAEGWAPYDGGDDFNAPLNSNTSGAPAGNHNDPSVDQGQDGQTTPGVTSGGTK